MNTIDDNLAEDKKIPIDTLIRISPLTKGPLFQKRNDIRKNLVLAILSKYSLNDKFRIQVIIDALQSEFKCNFQEIEVVKICDDLVVEKFLSHVKADTYTIKKRFELPDFNEITESTWADFSKHLKENYPDYDLYIDRDTRNIFNSILFKLLSRVAVSSNLTGNQIDNLPLDEFYTLTSNIVRQSNISELLKEKFIKIFLKYVETNTSTFKQFIIDSYTGIINLDIILREHEIPDIDFVEQLEFLLVDTTFLVALMCKTEPAHPLAVAITKQSKKEEIPMYYCYQTKQEMNALIRGSEREMDGLGTAGRHRIIQSQFVKDYNRENISWPDYITTLTKWESLVSVAWGITPIQEKIQIKSDDLNKEVYDYVIRVLPILNNLRNIQRSRKDPDYIPKVRDDIQVQHDAYCLAAISGIRIIHQKEQGKICKYPWFLTYDNLLTALDATYYKKDEIGIVMQPRALLNYYLAFSKLGYKNSDLLDVGEAIIKYTIRVPDSQISIDEYIRLITPKLTLEHDDEAIIKEVILASPLYEQLKMALSFDRGEEADRIIYNIFTDEKFVELIVGERHTREKLARVGERLKTTEQELQKERAGREALEKVLVLDRTINIQIKLDIDIKIQQKIESVIKLMELENLFDQNIIPKPPQFTNKERLKEWLNDAKQILETSKAVTDGARAIIPLLAGIISSII